MTTHTRASWLVYVLGALCAGAIVAAILVVGPASGSQASVTRTATVARGVVQSTVSGSGTLEPATKVGVNFATSGTLTGLFVSVGDHVTPGEPLAEIDPASAQASLRSAEIELSTDEAAYQDAVEGLTPSEQRQAETSAEESRASVFSAKQSLRQDRQTAKSEESSAEQAIAQDEASLKSTEQSVAVEAKSQQDALDQDISQRGTDEKAVVEARTLLEEAKSLLATEKAKSPPNEQKISSAESKVASAESTLRSAEAKVTQDGYTILTAQNNQAAGTIKGQQTIDNARNTVADAQKTKASTKLRSEQTIAQAKTSLSSAELSLQSTLAANEVKSAPPKTSTVVSAENNVKSAQMTVEKARQTLAETKLYAPTEGVIASIKNTVGESVSGNESSSGSSSASGASGGTGASGTGSAGTSAATGSGTGTGTSTGATGSGTRGANTGGAASSGVSGGTGGSTGAGSATGGTGSSTSEGGGSPSAGGGGASTSDSGSGSFHDIADTSSGGSGSHDIADPSASSSASSAGAAAAGSSESSSSGSSSSSSSFIELVDLHGYQLVVPLSESEISNVHVGQIATVTVEALEGRKFAAEVVSLPVLPTSSSGVVSYDVTFQLDQVEPGLKPGMSATAEVVVKQAEGVNVPTSAITADTVTVLHDGKREPRRVVTGLQGNSSTIVLSGLQAGEEIALPVAASTSSATSLTSRLGSRLGGAGLGGGGLGGGGGAPFFRGGG
jgi:multidrug efflux pump subunit AcrA (membrane-fusion protein)